MRRVAPAYLHEAPQEEVLEVFRDSGREMAKQALLAFNLARGAARGAAGAGEQAGVIGGLRRFFSRGASRAAGGAADGAATGGRAAVSGRTLAPASGGAMSAPRHLAPPTQTSGDLSGMALRDMGRPGPAQASLASTHPIVRSAVHNDALPQRALQNAQVARAGRSVAPAQEDLIGAAVNSTPGRTVAHRLPPAGSGSVPPVLPVAAGRTAAPAPVANAQGGWAWNTSAQQATPVRTVTPAQAAASRRAVAPATTEAPVLFRSGTPVPQRTVTPQGVRDLTRAEQVAWAEKGIHPQEAYLPKSSPAGKKTTSGKRRVAPAEGGAPATTTRQVAPAEMQQAAQGSAKTRQLTPAAGTGERMVAPAQNGEWAWNTAGRPALNKTTLGRPPAPPPATPVAPPTDSGGGLMRGLLPLGLVGGGVYLGGQALGAAGRVLQPAESAVPYNRGWGATY